MQLKSQLSVAILLIRITRNNGKKNFAVVGIGLRKYLSAALTQLSQSGCTICLQQIFEKISSNDLLKTPIFVLNFDLFSLDHKTLWYSVNAKHQLLNEVL